MLTNTSQSSGETNQIQKIANSKTAKKLTNHQVLEKNCVFASRYELASPFSTHFFCSFLSRFAPSHRDAWLAAIGFGRWGGGRVRPLSNGTVRRNGPPSLRPAVQVRTARRLAEESGAQVVDRAEGQPDWAGPDPAPGLATAVTPDEVFLLLPFGFRFIALFPVNAQPESCQGPRCTFGKVTFPGGGTRVK